MPSKVKPTAGKRTGAPGGAKSKVKGKAGNQGAAAKSGKPKLLSGGNPQIAKGDGAAPVKAYLAAMPGWKQAVGRKLDAAITRAVPGINKAVRWNSPFYGVAGQGYCLSFHCFTKFVRVTFLNGTSLSPMPPGTSKDPNTRYLDLYEDDELDKKQFADWARQAASRPGWEP